ncbi:hypothetical protein HPG69_013884 [Diceros bicornis minor]|uniref:Immunoglobulin-like beta-sandwich domain-containing protein n=1 Tax=Diceros bicornis minor TaxID=77932 RepID=A0A7J7EMD4_DICBM|nr:hypothetical protein HPG69_013884 [Diceros bicornis minor]
MVPLGGNVTLQCYSHFPFVMFKIFKIDVTHVTELQRGLFKNNFTISLVTAAHAGSYRCPGSYSHSPMWSAHNDPLRIVVTGVFTKPFVSAHPGSLVHAGGTVTLRCHSELAFDTFILLKEGTHGILSNLQRTFLMGTSKLISPWAL